MFQIITTCQYNDSPSFQMMLSFIGIRVSIISLSSGGSYVFTEAQVVVMQQKITGLVHTAVLITDWTTSVVGLDWSKCGNLFGLFWRKWRSRCRVQLLSHWTRRTKRWVRNSPASVITRLVQNGSEQRSCQLPLPPFDHQLFYSASNNPFSFVSSCCLR